MRTYIFFIFILSFLLPSVSLAQVKLRAKKPKPTFLEYTTYAQMWEETVNLTQANGKVVPVDSSFYGVSVGLDYEFSELVPGAYINISVFGGEGAMKGANSQVDYYKKGVPTIAVHGGMGYGFSFHKDRAAIGLSINYLGRYTQMELPEAGAQFDYPKKHIGLAQLDLRFSLNRSWSIIQSIGGSPHIKDSFWRFGLGYQ